MKRSDFLAIIPALSAIPLLGKNIVKTDGGIFIEKPIPIIPSIPAISNWYDIDVQLWVGDQQVGSGKLTQLTMTGGMYETTCRDNDGANVYLPGSQEITFEGYLDGPLNITRE